MAAACQRSDDLRIAFRDGWFLEVEQAIQDRHRCQMTILYELENWKRTPADNLAQMLVGRRRGRVARQQYEQRDAKGQSVGEARVDVGAVSCECISHCALINGLVCSDGVDGGDVAASGEWCVENRRLMFSDLILGSSTLADKHGSVVSLSRP